MTIPETGRDRRDDQRHPQGIKAQRKRDFIHSRAWLLQIMAWPSGMSAGLPWHRCALLWALAQDPEDNARARLQCSTTLGKGLLTATLRLLNPPVGRKGVGAPQGRHPQKPLPRSKSKNYVLIRALGTEDLHRGLTSLLTARYSKAWLTQKTAGVFCLTQFHQTTQRATDSGQIL